MLAHGGLRTWQSSTLALLTPGYRFGGVSLKKTSSIPDARFSFKEGLLQACSGGEEPESTKEETTKKRYLFHELGFIGVFVFKWDVCVWRGVQQSDNRWQDGMCAKEGNQGMFFLIYFFI